MCEKDDFYFKYVYGLFYSKWGCLINYFFIGIIFLGIFIIMLFKEILFLCEKFIWDKVMFVWYVFLGFGLDFLFFVF